MYEDRIVLCVSNAYEKKFYLNEEFQNLPQMIKDEVKIMCVLFTEDVGGILTLYYDDNGNLMMDVNADEGDLLFDDIGSGLLIKKIREEKRELLESLEMYFKVFFLGEDAADLLDKED